MLHPRGNRARCLAVAGSEDRAAGAGDNLSRLAVKRMKEKAMAGGRCRRMAFFFQEGRGFSVLVQ